MKKNNYTPQPVDTSDIELPPELLTLTERIAENVHDVWAVARITDGWTYGTVRNDASKQHPCLVPYEELSENEKEYDRNTAMETLRLINKLGFEIKTKGGKL
jgi:ryanodine receptor 2